MTSGTRMTGRASLMAMLRRFADRHPDLLRPMRPPLLALIHRLAERENRTHDALLNRFTGLLAQDPCLRVDEFEGEFFLDPRSALLRRVLVSGHYEPVLSRLCATHCDSQRDVLDIGANVGFHAVLFARHLACRKVLSVEPTRRALERLKRNVKHNGVDDRVIVHHGAVSHTPGDVLIKTIAGREEYSSLGDLVHPSIVGADFQTESVRADTLDALVSQYALDPGFLKIDVEGAELWVLQGAHEVLSQSRPVILAELSDPLLRANGASAAMVVDLIGRYDYDIRDPQRPDARPGSREFGDILCVPR